MQEAIGIWGRISGRTGDGVRRGTFRRNGAWRKMITGGEAKRSLDGGKAGGRRLSRGEAAKVERLLEVDWMEQRMEVDQTDGMGALGGEACQW